MEDDSVIVITFFNKASRTTQRLDQRRRPARRRSLQDRQVRTNKVPGDRAKRQYRNICLGTQALS